MKNKQKYLNIFNNIYNNNFLYKSNLNSNNKLNKSNMHFISLKKDSNSFYPNKENKKEIININPKNINLLNNYLLFSKNHISINNKGQKHISSSNDNIKKREKFFNIKINLQNICGNKSEKKITLLKNTKILSLKNIQNNMINIPNNKNNSENFFPFLNSKINAISNNNKNNIINMKSSGNIFKKKKSIRNTINFNSLNNILNKNKNQLSLNPSSGIFKLKDISNKNNNSTKKKILNIFSEENIKSKIKSLMLLSPSINNNSKTKKNNKEEQNNVESLSPENLIRKKIKKYILNNKKDDEENNHKPEKNEKKINLSLNNKEMANLKTISYINGLKNPLNLRIFSLKNKEKNTNLKTIINTTLKEYNEKNKLDLDTNIINEKQIKESNNNSKTISHNNNNQSQISKSTIYDYNYYMNESNKLSQFIKNYYNENKKYPESKIEFYKFGRKIGQGAFGKVNLGLHILTGRVVAIKSFKKENCSEEQLKKILNEKNLMKELENKNIIKILDYFEDKDFIFIVMEYVNGGNLYNLLKKRRKLSEKMAKFIYKQIVLSLKYIHSHNIVHRDIKLENILLDLNNGVKICDFGIGKKIKSPDQLLNGLSGTPIYMAPEILLSDNNKGYKGFPVDIWSSGVALYIMLSGEFPFKKIKKEHKKKELEYSILNEEPKEIKDISKEANNLIKGLLNKDPNKRLSYDEILSHPWIKNNDLEEGNILCQLFTKNEIIMLSNAYIDYRKEKNENLKEYFNLSNLYNDIKEDIKDNVDAKSVILTPFNTMLSLDNESDEKNLENIDFQNIKIENDILEIGNKVKEHFRLYELNNNNEIDNGIMIYTQLYSKSSNISNYSKINDLIGNNPEIDKKNIIGENKNIFSNILSQLNNFGYNEQYIIDCLKSNEINYATASYYLLLNYDKSN